MSFASLIADTRSQFAAALATPVPFALVVGVAAVAIWKVVSWHLGERLDSLKEQVGTLERRLALKDDEISHLKRLAETTASIRTGETDRSTPDAVGDPAKPDGAAPMTDRDFLLPWRVYIPCKEREFVDYDAFLSLLTSLEDATSAQRSALMKPYMRKWVRIQTDVLDVDEREEETCVSSETPGGRARFLWMHFTRDREALSHLRRGDRITLVGWIEEAGRSSIRLYGCERISA